MEMNDVSISPHAQNLSKKLGYKCRVTLLVSKGIARISTQYTTNGHETPVYIDIPDDRIDDIPFIQSEFDKAFAERELALSEVREIRDDIAMILANAGLD